MALGGITTSRVLFGLVGSLVPVSMPVVILGGIAFMGVSRKWRLDAARKAEYRAWLRTRVDEAVVDIRTEVDRAITEAKFTIGTTMRQSIQQRADEVRRAISLHDRALREDQQTRTQAKATAMKNLAALGGLTEQVDGLLAEVGRAAQRTATGSADRGAA